MKTPPEKFILMTYHLSPTFKIKIIYAGLLLEKSEEILNHIQNPYTRSILSKRKKEK